MKNKQKCGYKICLQSLLVVMVLITACSTDETKNKQEASQAETSLQMTEQAAQTLPDFFPKQIPLPDDYIVVRNGSRVSGQFGREVEMNIALPGTIEEWVETYEEVLMSEFEDVKFQEDRNSLQWRFHGHGFDYGVLYLNENQGHLDRGKIDSGHLPVILTLKMTEHQPEE